ncbi:MAG TPA: ATP-binding cassette domain-containing protein [Sediminibacterium sp.]|nr:ATP-binding cassette domain-containing protein [Sediminibacterium sp.]
MSSFKYLALEQAGKRFNRDWIFRAVNYVFEPGKAYAITGPNGSGKSTLLQAIAGNLQLSHGAVQYILRDGERDSRLEPENFFSYLAIVAPYLELVEEMTGLEFLQFHRQFKPLIPGITTEQVLEAVNLSAAAGKQIRYFSSGMKQRLKLAQAVFSDVPVLLLDEPCTNLDADGYVLYHRLITGYCAEKLIIVSSNDAQEMDYCSEKLSILDYK